MSLTRADRHNNPTAFTTDVAHQAGLILGTDYEQGDLFTFGGSTYYTAKLLGDPLRLSVQVIDKVGFYNKSNHARWEYIAMPRWVWELLNIEQKIQIIHFMYNREGGVYLEELFQ